MKTKKFFAYVDESGQDTKGKFFVVSVLILENNKDIILKKLEKIEKETKKENIKWSKSNSKFRKKYIERIAELNIFKKSIFFHSFYNSKEFLKFTAIATGKAILTKTKNHDNFKITIYIDAFTKQEIKKFKQEIKVFNIKKKKIRGVRREQNNTLIRLVDAICGLIRQNKKGDDWAKKILKQFKKRNIIKEL